MLPGFMGVSCACACCWPAVQQALQVLQQGIVNRRVDATEHNAASSRSHCIFTCHVESRWEH